MSDSRVCHPPRLNKNQGNPLSAVTDMLCSMSQADDELVGPLNQEKKEGERPSWRVGGREMGEIFERRWGERLCVRKERMEGCREILRL